MSKKVPAAQPFNTAIDAVRDLYLRISWLEYHLTEWRQFGEELDAYWKAGQPVYPDKKIMADMHELMQPTKVIK